jgi:hypothetical protein
MHDTQAKNCAHCAQKDLSRTHRLGKIDLNPRARVELLQPFHDPICRVNARAQRQNLARLPPAIARVQKCCYDTSHGVNARKVTAVNEGRARWHRFDEQLNIISLSNLMHAILKIQI